MCKNGLSIKFWLSCFFFCMCARYSFTSALFVHVIHHFTVCALVDWLVFYYPNLSFFVVMIAIFCQSHPNHMRIIYVSRFFCLDCVHIAIFYDAILKFPYTFFFDSMLSFRAMTIFQQTNFINASIWMLRQSLRQTTNVVFYVEIADDDAIVGQLEWQRRRERETA